MAQRSFCGIDVAKDRLDVMVLPEELCWSVANDAAGWAELVARLRGLRIAASGIEAARKMGNPDPATTLGWSAAGSA